MLTVFYFSVSLVLCSRLDAQLKNARDLAASEAAAHDTVDGQAAGVLKALHVICHVVSF